MKWIVAALTVLVLAAHASATTVQVKTGEKLTQITTDCWWVQKDAKNVVMRPLVNFETQQGLSSSGRSEDGLSCEGHHSNILNRPSS